MERPLEISIDFFYKFHFKFFTPNHYVPELDRFQFSSLSLCISQNFCLYKLSLYISPKHSPTHSSKERTLSPLIWECFEQTWRPSGFSCSVLHLHKTGIHNSLNCMLCNKKKEITADNILKLYYCRETNII